MWYIGSIVCTASWWWGGQPIAPMWAVFNINHAKGKGRFCGVKYFAHQNEKQQHTNATQHEASSTAKLAAMFFYFLFFFPFRANCRRVAYVGMLPGLSCFKWNSLASTPPPPLATMSQTLTSLMEEKKKAQCATTVGSDKVKKTKQLQGQSRSADSVFCTTNWLLVLMLQVLLKGRPCLLEKELLSGLDRRELVVSNYR